MTAPYAILVDAVSFVGSAFFVGRIRKLEDKPERSADAHLGREISEGFNFVVRNKVLRSIAACTGSSNLFSGIGGAMLILLLAGHLHISPGLIGVVFSLMAIGGLIGALTAQRFAKWLGQGPVIWISIGVTSPFALFVPLTQPGWKLWAMALGNFVYWIGVVVYNVNQVSFRQALTPDRLLGRMNATMRFLVWGTLPLGGLTRWHPRPDDRRAQHAVGQRDRRNVLVPVRLLLARALRAPTADRRPWRRSAGLGRSRPATVRPMRTTSRVRPSPCPP